MPQPGRVTTGTMTAAAVSALVTVTVTVFRLAGRVGNERLYILLEPLGVVIVSNNF